MIGSFCDEAVMTHRRANEGRNKQLVINLDNNGGCSIFSVLTLTVDSPRIR